MIGVRSTSALLLSLPSFFINIFFGLFIFFLDNDKRIDFTMTCVCVFRVFLPSVYDFSTGNIAPTVNAERGGLRISSGRRARARGRFKSPGTLKKLSETTDADRMTFE